MSNESSPRRRRHFRLITLVLLAYSCAPVAGIEEIPCSPGCSDATTRLLCDEDGNPRTEACPAATSACAASTCSAGQCGFAPAPGAACGPDALGLCNDAYACLGPGTRLSAIRHNACVLTDEGELFCWGENVEHQLGDGTSEERGHPVRVRGLPGPAVDVSVGYAHACALLPAGEVYCWGNNDGGQVGTAAGNEPVVEPSRVVVDGGPIPFRSVHAGYGHTCAVTEDSRVYCWGYTNMGQCGVDGAQLGTYSVGPTLIPGLDSVIAIETVKNHICAVRSSAPTLVCWGSNRYGDRFDRKIQEAATTEERVVLQKVHKLGQGASLPDLEYSTVPLPVSLDDGAPVLDVGMSYESTYAVTATGRVYAWGFNVWLQLGTEDQREIVEVPALVYADYPWGHLPLADVSDLLRSDGSDMCAQVNGRSPNGSRHLCWGANDEGELALGDPAWLDRDVPFARATVLPPSTRNVVRGENFGCGLVTEEEATEVWCWGQERYVASGAIGPDAQAVIEPRPIRWVAEGSGALPAPVSGAP